MSQSGDEASTTNWGTLAGWGALLSGVAAVLAIVFGALSGNNDINTCKSSLIDDLEAHEKSFTCEPDLRRITQQENANAICRSQFRVLKQSGDLGGLNPNTVVHIWAHMDSGYCIANTPEI